MGLMTPTDVIGKYILGQMTASSANALPPNVTDMFRSAATSEGSQTAAVKHELAGSPAAAVKAEPEKPQPASPTASPPENFGYRAPDLVGDLGKLRAETMEKFKASGIDITADGGDGGGVGGVMKRPSSVMKRPAADGGDGGDVGAVMKRPSSATDVKMERPSSVMKRPAAGCTWKREVKTLVSGREYPIYIAPNGVRFYSKLAAKRAKPIGYTE